MLLMMKYMQHIGKIKFVLNIISLSGHIIFMKSEMEVCLLTHNYEPFI